MKLNLSNELREIIAYSREEAMRTGSYEITPDHLILGLLRYKDNAAYKLLVQLKVSIPYIKLKICDKYEGKETIPYDDAEKIRFSVDCQEVLNSLFAQASILFIHEPESLCLLLAVLTCEGCTFTSIMTSELGWDYDKLVHQIARHSEGGRKNSDEELETSKSQPLSEDSEALVSPRSKKKNSVLEKYGFDMTRAALEGKLDPVVGRDKEIERLAQILGRRKKNNPILVGEPGVGKSAIAEGLAIRIAQRNVSRALLDKKIISLDIGSIVAGTKFRGQFEERIKEILNEIKNDNEIILFIDEMHTLVGAGGAVGSLDAANMLKPALSRGEIQCIGATTLDEFREVIEKDGALERRLQKIMVEPTSFEETLDILQKIKGNYEIHHGVTYSEESLKACISLSNRYITDRCLPDKAIDVLDEAGSKHHLMNQKVPKEISMLENEEMVIRKAKNDAASHADFENAQQLRLQQKEILAKLRKAYARWEKNGAKLIPVITADDIALVISTMTGIPANKIALSESNKLLHLDSIIRERIIGQDEAVNLVVKAIQRNRAGLKDPNKPIGTFLFLGPTGVGKTQLAKVLAECMFDSQDNIIRIDMSEYMEKFSVSRLIGAPPGYVGYGEGGQLSERVRRKPYSVVLLDEIEKAHPDIFSLLLQVLDEGRLTDSNGRRIDFRNTIVIMTSNIGSREIKDFGNGIGYGAASKDDNAKNKIIVEKALGKTFTPEFLNRLDEQIYFNSLSRADIERIIDIELKDLLRRIVETGYTLKIEKKAKTFIADMGYDVRFGARPLKRAIQKYIENPVAEIIISGIPVGSTIKIELNSGKDNVIAKLDAQRAK